MNKAIAAAVYEKRKNAVAAVQRGELVSVVMRTHNVAPRTLFNWLSKYRSGGWHALRTADRSGRPRKVSGPVMEWLYQAITLGDPRQYQMPFCLWTLNIIREMLQKVHKISLSKSAVCRLLQQMGLSPQRPLYRSYKQNPKELEKYLRRTFPQLRKEAERLGAEIYFVDESALRSDHHRGRTWGAVGQTPVVKDSGDRFGLKLISAVSPRGDMRFATIESGMNSDKFIAFLKKLRLDAGKPIIVIADNATYHTSQKVVDFAQKGQGNITLGHLPKYAPELNPDEQVWNHVKARLAKLFIDSKETMKQKTLNILRSIQKQRALVKSFFKLSTTSYASLKC